MNWIAVSFVAFATFSAAAVGWAVRWWLHAAAVLPVAYGVFAMATTTALLPTAKLFLPLFSGAAVAAVLLVPILLIWPAASRNIRVIPGTVAAFATHSIFIHYAMAMR